VSGSAISSGLFVPMLVMGACVGRLVGLGVVDTAAYYGFDDGIFKPPSPWSWMDPGVFALLGAGAFMAGVSRLSLSLAVIVMEVSGTPIAPCNLGRRSYAVSHPADARP
jgi:H+/Cl- antiporter ClcA